MTVGSTREKNRRGLGGGAEYRQCEPGGLEEMSCGHDLGKTVPVGHGHHGVHKILNLRRGVVNNTDFFFP